MLSPIDLIKHSGNYLYSKTVVRKFTMFYSSMKMVVFIFTPIGKRAKFM